MWSGEGGDESRCVEGNQAIRVPHLCIWNCQRTMCSSRMCTKPRVESSELHTPGMVACLWFFHYSETSLAYKEHSQSGEAVMEDAKTGFYPHSGPLALGVPSGWMGFTSIVRDGNRPMGNFLLWHRQRRSSQQVGCVTLASLSHVSKSMWHPLTNTFQNLPLAGEKKLSIVEQSFCALWRQIIWIGLIKSWTVNT